MHRRYHYEQNQLSEILQLCKDYCEQVPRCSCKKSTFEATASLHNVEALTEKRTQCFDDPYQYRCGKDGLSMYHPCGSSCVCTAEGRFECSDPCFETPPPVFNPPWGENPFPEPPPPTDEEKKANKAFTAFCSSSGQCGCVDTRGE
jgi:hypothetical protein